MNALIKAPGAIKDKVVFVTNSPCVLCAKLIHHAGIVRVLTPDGKSLRIVGQTHKRQSAWVTLQVILLNQ